MLDILLSLTLQFCYYVLGCVHLELRVEKVQAEASAKRHRKAGETFGDGMLPALQSAVFKVKCTIIEYRSRFNTEM